MFFSGVVDAPLELRFSTDVTEVGTQFQPYAFFASFTGNIIAYDVANNVIGTFSAVGSSTAAGDNSALFLGIRTSSGDAAIRRVLFSTPGYGVAVNQISFGNANQAAAVPEPSTYAMFGFGLLALVVVQRRKKTAEQML